MDILKIVHKESPMDGNYVSRCANATIEKERSLLNKIPILNGRQSKQSVTTKASRWTKQGRDEREPEWENEAG